MKSLKKTLSLVLVIVMVLGMVGVAGAAYKDEADIQYKEAVNVMTGIGALEGDQGSFNPKGSITRAEAAKLVTYATLGAKIASGLSASKSSFTDVPASHWALGSIEYLVTKGIVNGRGDGTFDPNGKVTGYELGKMLLASVGFNKNGEYDGTGWSINVAIDAGKIGLFEGSKAAKYSDAATREEAALYCFNGILYSPVTGETVTVTRYMLSIVSSSDTELLALSGDTYASIADAKAAVRVADPTAVLGVNYSLTPYTDTVKVKTGSIAANVYSTLTSDAKGTDSHGRPASIWKYGPKQNTISAAYATPVASFNTPVKEGQLFTALGKDGAIPVITNTIAGKGTASMTAKKGGADVATGTGFGVVTEIFNVGTAAAPEFRAVQTTPGFATVSAVSSHKATAIAGAYTSYTVGTATGKVFSSVVDAAVDVDTAAITGTVNKGDKVLYYKDVDGTLHIEAVTTMDGVLTSISSAGALTIDGATHMKAAVGTVTPSAKSQTFYKDSFGYVIAAKDPIGTGVQNHGVVIATKVIYTFNATTSTMSPAEVAIVAAADGTILTLPTGEDTNANKDLNGKLVTYAVNTAVTSATVYTITEVVPDKTTTAAITGVTSKTNLLEGPAAADKLKYADAGTLFVVTNYGADKKPTGTVTVYTGINNVPTYLGLKNAFAVDTSRTADGVANVVFINENKDATQAAKLVYVTGSYSTTALGKVYNTIVDGQPSTITVLTTVTMKPGMYSSITVTAGTPDKTEPDATALASITGIKVSGGLFFTTTNNEDFVVHTNPTVAAAAQVFVIHAVSGTSDTVAAADVDTLTYATAVHVVTNDADNVAAVYVIYAD